MPVGPGPTFSVLVAAYNAADTVAAAVTSALEQTLPPLEVIVCNDGSTDDPATALEGFADRITLIDRENGGEGAAKNTAAAAASGTFLVFLDADDVFAPTRLERLAELAAAEPELDVLTTDAHLIVDGRRAGSCYSPSWHFEVNDQRREILRRNFVFGLAAVRRESFEAVGGFDPQFRHAVDWDLWIRLVLRGSRIGLVDEPLAEYRLHRGSLSADRARLLRGRAAVLEKAAGLSVTPAERSAVLALARKQRALASATDAREALRARRTDARELSRQAMREPGLGPVARVKALGAVVAPAAAGALVRRSERREGVTGPAGVRFEAQTSKRDFNVTAADVLRAGRTAWSMYERQPDLLRSAELGFPWEPKLVPLILFRASLAVRPPLRLLGLVDRLIGDRAAGTSHALLVRHLYWRGVRETVPSKDVWRRLLYGTPILMYHAIGGSDEQPSRYVVPEDRFRRQMRWLVRRGYRVLELDEYVALRRSDALPPHKSLVVTLDDGYLDNCTRAAPVLDEHRLPATVFVVTGRLGRENDWSAGDALERRPLASPDQLHHVRPRGMGLGGHTRSHVRLTDESPERAREEIHGCRQDLARLGVTAEAFAYPYGAMDEPVEQEVAAAGFLGACSVRPGLNRARTPLFALRRAEIRGTDSWFRFLLAVHVGDPNAVLARRRRRRA